MTPSAILIGVYRIHLWTEREKEGDVEVSIHI